MMKISTKEFLKSQVRQIKKEIDWAISLNNYVKAQELLFEMIEIEKKLN
jgi:hypothetical protein